MQCRTWLLFVCTSKKHIKDNVDIKKQLKQRINEIEKRCLLLRYMV